MPRRAGVGVPGGPPHGTPRGHRRQPPLFCDEDYEAYLALMADWCPRRGGERFIMRIERLLGRVLRPHKRGPKGPWKHKQHD